MRGTLLRHEISREAQGDHPRVCGEHCHVVGHARRISGSSPRMRGTLLEHVAVGAGDGIIPAYAGNTIRNATSLRKTGDHPRVCGEHVMMVGSFRLSKGSSPRMRGTLDALIIGVNRSGIIPAYAGNTGKARVLVSSHRDHPRVCGEHQERRGHLRFVSGSSPRMRGTHST